MRKMPVCGAKKNRLDLLALAKNFKGQMTLFFAIAMVLILTLMAFLVNVGMFVKAKINLQNAVDAAAYSGAAVQARQLTDIAYLNWELRNIYKEFMFKYYVLGQLSNPNTQMSKLTGSAMDFRLPSLNSSDPQDEFNIPSICIQFNDPGNSSSNICAVYSVPGVPRFQPVGLPGLDETHNEFINRIVQQKAQDCASRSELNFKTATNWAYAVKLDNDSQSADIFGDAPQIATDRMGAWPAAIELAIRIRNMEKVVNTAPESVCLGGGNGCKAIDDLNQTSDQFPVSERTVKAFWAAYRNLGSSGKSGFLNLDNVTDENELKQTFKLTELAPTTKEVSGTSSLLIPAKGDRTKRYLDLRLYLLNFAIFYNAFAALSGQEVGAPAHAKCAVTKIAVPIPAYPFGYDKNPAFMTYYAVKGEVKYRSLLNPFQERVGEGVSMVAYAAAAPFGGRIGPMLFSNNGDNITARTDAQNRSFPYITALQTGGGAFRIGAPMPVKSDFWVQGPGETIGGKPDGGASVKFAVPNLLFDTVDSDSLKAQVGDDRIHIVSGESAKRAGLYDVKQYRAMRMSLERAKNGGGVDSTVVAKSILGVRAPTRYEAMNYLIPNVHEQGTRLDTPAYIPNPDGHAGTPDDPLVYLIPGPLFGAGTHFNSIQDIKDVVNEYITNNRGAVETYVASLKEIAGEITRDSQAQAGGGGQGLERKNLYDSAAKIIYDESAGNPTCTSLAGAFQSYFTGTPSCGYQPLADNIGQAVQNREASSQTFRNYYQIEYVHPPEDVVPQNQRDFLLTAYMPGPRSGAENTAVVNHPFLASENRNNLARRNFYSTKFVSFQSLILNTPYSTYAQVQEGNLPYNQNNPVGVTDGTGVANLLNLPEILDLFL